MTGNVPVDLTKMSVEYIYKIKDEIDWREFCISGKANWNIDFIENFMGYIEFGYSATDGDGRIIGEIGLSSNANINWSTELLLKYEDNWDYDELLVNDSFINFFLASIDYTLDNNDLELILIN